MRFPLNATSRVEPTGARFVRGRAAALSLLALVGAGCGAKTGLEVPDVVDVVDASVCIHPDAGPIVVDLETEAQVATADVLFVMDRTGSMDQEIDNIRNGLRTVIVPGLARTILDLQLGVATYGDFPVEPYGAREETPFTMAQRMTRDVTAVQGALNRVRAGFGGDNPEAMVEALYQVATGEGLGTFIERAGGCPSVGHGYPCFRPRAQTIILLIADAPTHNGPVRMGAPSHPYNRTLFAPNPAPHTYEETVAALRRANAHVIGINSGAAPFSGREDLEQLARDTGSIGQDGRPLVFDIGSDGSGLDEQVVHAVRRFTAEVRFGTVTARALDIDGSGGADLVVGVRPLRADPMSQVGRIDANGFHNVVPGTRLTFGLELDAERARPSEQERRYRVRVEFLADGRPTLGFRDIEIVIPASGCITIR